MGRSAPGHVLFVGTLVQKSALSTSGSSARGETDHPLAVDGLGRPTLSGRGLAGALVATLDKLGWGVSRRISSRVAEESRDHPPRSCWRVHNSHLEGGWTVEPRAGVRILHETGAQADGSLHDRETLPAGQRWPFLMDVEVWPESREAGEDPVRDAAAALLEWTRGQCWLGGGGARGLGWMRLEGLHAYRLEADGPVVWPDSRKSIPRILENLERERCQGRLTFIEADAFPREFSIPAPGPGAWSSLTIEGRLEVGPRTDGYGLDLLSVGAHAGVAHLAQHLGEALRTPAGRDAAAAAVGFDPDRGLAFSRDPVTRQVRPYIPGSSLRGPLRHGLARLLARTSLESDPRVRDRFEKVFGAFKGEAQPLDGQLLISDASLEDGTSWKVAWLQHHAEDELAGGVFEDSKFDRLALMEGTFRFRMVLEGEDRAELERMADLLGAVLEQAEAGFLPLGGAKWRGAGWPRWRFSRGTIERYGALAEPHGENAPAMGPADGASPSPGLGASIGRGPDAAGGRAREGPA